MEHSPILLSLAVEKDAQTNALVLQVVFRPDASNIALTKSTIAWYPTAQELRFLSEAFALVCPPSPEPEQPPVPPQHHPTIGKDPSIRDTATEEEIHAAVVAKKNAEEQDQVLVQVDDTLIDEALKRRKTNDTPPKTTEESLVDRLTRRKKTV